ncbi:MAG: VWA domain-containing protein [Thermoanaerobaculia bacterium]
MRSFTVSSPLLLSLCLLVPLAPAAARAADKPPATFEGASQVTAVEVPVNVVGKDGEPVRGLTADDFEVYDGSERQKVTGFDVIDLKALETRLESAAQKAPEDIPSAARRHILLLFDLSFSSPTSILKARLAAREFVLKGLHPADLAAVATFSLETGPKLIITFTPDRAQLARAIDTLGYRQAFDRAAKNDPLRFMIEPPASDQSSGFGVGEGVDLRAQREQIVYEYLKAIAFAAERSERSFEVGRISGYSRALADMARSLNSVQGRKQVVFFSEGFDSRLLIGRSPGDKETEEDNFNAAIGQTWMVDSDQRYGNTGLQGDINRMLEEFRRADCVIQAVDIGGLRAGADERARPSGQEGLFYFANETGGELYRDANNLREPLERVLERSSVTYLLSFERSDLKLDGAYHRLKVKAKLPAGARMSYRAGYYAPRPFKELDPLEKSLLASDGIAAAAPRRDISLNVLSAPFRATPSRAYVPVIIEVSGRSLLEGHAAKKLNVEFYTYVSDFQGQMHDFFTQRVALDVDKAATRQAMLDGGIKYYGHFDLPTGSYRVRVLVRNADTGRTGVETVEVNVPSYEATQAVLLPPFFIEDRQKWLLIREQTGGELGTVVYPFTVGGEPYIPAARPVLRNQPARLCLVAYNLGQGNLAVAGEVTAPDGKSFPAGKLLNVERTSTGIQGLDKVTATFDPSGLGSGDYVLQVAVTDPATGLKHTNSLPFQIVR